MAKANNSNPNILESALRAIQQRIAQIEAALQDQEALLSERRRLQTALAALDGSAPAPKPEVRHGGRRRKRTRMSSEERHEQILGLVRADPDIKTREVAERLGTSPNNVYNLLRKMEESGVITKSDGKIVLVG